MSVGKACANESSSGIELVNEQLYLVSDATGDLTISDAVRAFENQQFSRNRQAQVSFGFTHKTLWAVLQINNESNDAYTQVVKIDNAWLDEIDIYFVQNKRILKHVSLGDNLPFSQRPIARRMPAVPYQFPKGLTDVYFRIKAKDPLTIPIYIGAQESHIAVASSNAYFYGALYGSLSILFTTLSFMVI